MVSSGAVVANHPGTDTKGGVAKVRCCQSHCYQTQRGRGLDLSPAVTVEKGVWL